jgi:hypothetical protein
MNANDLIGKLSKRYQSPAFAFLTQVRNGTGFSKAPRTADAMAMGLWPSRGLNLHGFEIKVSRGDWLRELKAPEKADELVRYCDHWWIVVPDRSLVLDGELPPTWGLMAADGRGGSLKVVREAPVLDPDPIDRPFLASVFRNVTDGMIPRDSIKAEKEAEYERGRQSMENQVKWAEEARDKLDREVKAFREASGINLNSYADGKELGEAVQLVRQGKHKRVQQDLDRLRDSAKRIVDFIDDEKAGNEIW